MRSAFWLPFIFCILLVEIGSFVIVGQRIGLWSTLALVILAFIAGAIVISGQARRLYADLIRRQSAGKPVALDDLTDALVVFIAGCMLIVPGFAGDIVAILLLIIAPLRKAFGQCLTKFVNVRVSPFGLSPDMDWKGSPQEPHSWQEGQTIDLDEDEYHANKSQKSGSHRLNDVRKGK